MEQTNTQSLQSTVVYILSTNFNAPHIQQLVRLLALNSVSISLQTDKDSLPLLLDRRYFVLVDNIQGAIVLGPWFNSLLLFIVGYPKKGANKKNHYCASPKQVLDKYNEFCSLPEFVRKKYLCSNVSSNTYLKSSRTVKSFVSNTKETSEGSENKNHEKNEKKNEHSKLLLYLSNSDFSYNKWIYKIATSNSKKFQTVDSIQEIDLVLSVCRSKTNFLLVNQKQYNAELKEKEVMKQLKIIIYSSKEPNMVNTQENVIGLCSNHTGVINMIRQVGFQVVSLKDIDKSIVKYGNQFGKKKGNKSNKRILWQGQVGTNTKSQPHQKFNQYINHEQQNLSQQSQCVQKLDISSGSAPIYMSNLSNNSEVQGGVSLQSLKVSNQKQVLERGLERKRSSIETNLRSHKQLKTSRYMKKSKGYEEDCINNQYIYKGRLQKNSTSRLKPIESFDSSSQTSKNSVGLVKHKATYPDIMKGQEYHMLGFSSASDSESYDNHYMVSSKGSLILKSPLGCRNSESTTFPQIDLTVKKKMKQEKKGKQNRAQKVLTYRKQLVQIQENIIQKKHRNDEEISRYSLLWKSFNIRIEKYRDTIVKKMKNGIVNQRAFYFVTQLKQMLSQIDGTRLIIFLDDLDVQRYLKPIMAEFDRKLLSSIYIFQRQETKHQNFVFKIRSILKKFEPLKKMIKPVPVNEYIDEGIEVMNLITSELGNYD